MREGDEEIGWMFDIPPQQYPKKSDPSYIHPSEDTTKRKLPFSLDGRIKLNEGWMLPQQLDLMLQFMPVDITYVDENDIVIFYNRGDKRVFPRSAGIIGREVKFCHPPKSVDQVLRILEEFKAGRKDEAAGDPDQPRHALRDRHEQERGRGDDQNAAHYGAKGDQPRRSGRYDAQAQNREAAADR
jgi:DUF438 domain-containing protein